LLFFLLPRPLMRLVGHASHLRHAVDWLVRPKVALTSWGLAYGGWHIPAAYDYAARHQAIHDLEHASFVTAGLLVWGVLIDPARRRKLSRGRRLGVAALLFWMGTAISDVLIFSFHPLYPAYANQAERVFSLSPVRDQQFAGLVMTIDQLLTLGTCAAVLLWPALRERRRTQPVVAAEGQLA
jgi:cytochrome c oxidase assembly factor CtaG